MKTFTTIKLLSLLTSSVLLTSNLYAKGLGANHGYGIGEKIGKSDVVKPRYQGIVLEVLDGKSYTYLKIDEKIPESATKELKAFWIVVDKSSAKVGDYVRFQKELVTKNFKSKTLNKTFPEVMFASQLEYRVSK
jgi:hypothetical protein